MKHNIDNILQRVKTPGQYINHEYNSETYSISAKWNKKEVVKICLCYPDKYVVGMSNLGIEILYKLLNSYDDVLCERVFAVETDMENILRNESIELFSLETRHKLKEFDIIGFSLQHELSYTNIFTILSLAKIPFKRTERKDLFPLIIAGGPCSSNPYVLEEYIDFFVLGEAEESLISIVKIIKQFKVKNINNKTELLNEINNFNEVYIPGNEVKKVYPAVVDIKKSFYPKKPTVPIIRTTHNRLNIEVTRGCGYNCNFCQAGVINKPLRIRDKEYLFELIKEGLDNTGYEEVAFSGFCVTNYPYLTELVNFVHKNYDNKFVSISLPSLRIEDITEKLVEGLSYPRRTTITLAPETATERLRNVLNKKISNEEIFKKISILYKFGFHKIKFYFMIGLPTETNEDIEQIPKLVKILEKYFPKIDFNVSVSIFIPKPHTPFQFCKMDNYENLYNKLVFLTKNLKRELKISSIKSKIYFSFIEGMLSRGDKYVGKLIESVWFSSGRFDNWDEYFNPELWIEKIVAENIDLKKYIFTEYDTTYKFVWDNIQYSVSKEKLYQRYINSINNNNNETSKSLFLSTNNEDVIENKKTNVFISPSSSPKKDFVENPCTLRLRFSRKGDVKYISYLDQIEIIKRSLIMSNLPLCFTHGFNPQIKFSFAPPISVGYESNSEYVDIEIARSVNILDIKDKINKFLPMGFSLLSAKLFFSPLNKMDALNNIINLAEYIVFSEQEFDKDKLEKFFKTKSMFVEKQKFNSSIVNKIDLHEVVKNIKLIEKKVINLYLRIIPNKTLKPEVVINKIFDLDKENFQLGIIRENLFIEDSNGNVLELI
jgi:radical SAM-linked protein